MKKITPIFISDLIAKASLFSAIFLIPVYFDTRIQNVFDLSKLTAMYLLTLTLLASWSTKLLFSPKPLKALKPGPLKWQILTFFLISIISCLFSVNRTVSFFGYYRHYEGLLSLICYLTLFLSTINLFDKKSIETPLNILLLTGTSAAIYGIFQHFGLDPFSWQGAAGNPNRVSSTFGNSAFFSGYLVIIFPISITQYLRQKGLLPLIIYGAISFLLCTAFLLTNTRACYVGLFFGFLVLILLLIKRGILATKKAFLLILLLLIPTIYYNLKPETSTLGRFLSVFDKSATGEASSARLSTLAYKAETSKGFGGSAAVRFYLWKDVWKIIREYPILGTGLDTLGSIYLKYRSMGVFRTEGDAKADSAHNEFLDITQSRGIIGLLIYLWLIISFSYLCFKKAISLPKEEALLFIGILSGFISYIIQTLMSFGVTPVFSTLWIVMGIACVETEPQRSKKNGSTPILLPAIGVAIAIFAFFLSFSQHPLISLGILLAGMSIPASRFIQASQPFSKRYISVGVLLLVIALLFSQSLRPFMADLHYKIGTKEKERDARIVEYEKAVKLNPTIDWYQGELARELLEEAKGKRELVYLDEVIKRIERVIKAFPQDANNHNTLGLAYDFKRELEGVDTREKTVASYKKAIEWNPFYVGAYNNIGVIYGREANYEESEKYFTEALKIEPENGISLDNLHKISEAYLFYKKTDGAKRVLTNIAEFSPKYPRIMEIYTSLGTAYRDEGRMDKVKEICLLMIKVDPMNVVAHRNLGSLYFQEKSFKEAKREFEAVLSIQPDDAYSINLLKLCKEAVGSR
ncbi:O-antigen ligase family protein [bacterium]|nr:O-antigen ligase family protein [bacterium]